MTETQTIWLVLALVYAAECMRWLRPGQILARTWLGKRWRFIHPNRLLSNQWGGIIFGPPLPPLGTVYIAGAPQLDLAPAGFAPANDSLPVSEWSAKSRFTTNLRTVEIGGKRLFTAASPGLAREAAQTLERILKSNPGERSAAIHRHFASMLDTEAIRKRLAEYESATRGVRLLANLLFAFVFLIAPVAAWRFGFTNCWWALLVGVFALSIPIAWRFRRAHRSLHLEADEERFNHFLIVLLSPVSTIRALDLLSRPLLETFHPLAVARVLADDKTFRALASQTLRDLRYGAVPADPVRAASRTALLASIEEFLQREKINPTELLRPPNQVEPGCAAYCPRCLAQFTTIGNGCPDCGAPKLLAFPSIPAKAIPAA